jgi:hypothetical protein
MFGMMLISIGLVTAVGVHSSWLAVSGIAEKIAERGERSKEREKTVLLPLFKPIPARKIRDAPQVATVEWSLGLGQCGVIIGNHSSLRHFFARVSRDRLIAAVPTPGKQRLPASLYLP